MAVDQPPALVVEEPAEGALDDVVEPPVVGEPAAVALVEDEELVVGAEAEVELELVGAVVDGALVEDEAEAGVVVAGADVDELGELVVVDDVDEVGGVAACCVVVRSRTRTAVEVAPETSASTWTSSPTETLAMPSRPAMTMVSLVTT
ncbi:MAG: hypothetical protein QOJ19_3292 [Acidimicrobiia bacterium]|nr:hypothetical protein [Acidimicrobiia bacterium]